MTGRPGWRRRVWRYAKRPALPGRTCRWIWSAYSNGGALALKYALDSLEDSHLRQPQQIILLSPMIGVTAFARFAGLAGLPSVFPAFARAAWLNVAPEFNPFKYNSISGQGGETIVVIEPGAAAADYPRGPAGRAESAAADPHLSVGDGFHG